MNNTEVPAFVELDDDIHALMLTCNEGETVARLHGKATKLAQSTLEAMLATAFKEAAERACNAAGITGDDLDKIEVQPMGDDLTDMTVTAFHVNGTSATRSAPIPTPQ